MSIHLAPATEARLREEVARLGVSVDDFLLDAIAAYHRLAHATPPRVRQGPNTDRTAEMAWIAQPDPRFIGQWVVLLGDRVLTSGSSARAAFDQAKAQGVEVPFLVYVSPHRNEPFAGGWLD